MIKEFVKSEELKQCICLRADKMEFDEVTDDDILQIQEMDFRGMKLNGEPTDLDLEALRLFPNLNSLSISDFYISEKQIELISKLSKLTRIQFNSCEFSSDIKTKLPQTFATFVMLGCENIKDFSYPEVRALTVKGGEIDFEKIDFSSAERLYLQNNIIRNITDVEQYTGIEEINLDGSTLYDKAENKKEKIKVSDTTTLHSDRENIDGYEIDF